MLGKDFRILRIGHQRPPAGGPGPRPRRGRPQAGAIAITGLREARATGRFEGDLDAVEWLARRSRRRAGDDGHRLRDVLQEWAIRHVQYDLPGYFNNARVIILGGVTRPAGPGPARVHRQHRRSPTRSSIDLVARLGAVPVARARTPASAVADPPAARDRCRSLLRAPGPVNQAWRARRRGTPTSSSRRTRRSSPSDSTTSAARRSSPRPSPTISSPSSPAATSTWSSTPPRSPSMSPSRTQSSRRCSLRARGPAGCPRPAWSRGSTRRRSSHECCSRTVPGAGVASPS